MTSSTSSPRLRFALAYPAALLSSCKCQPSPITANGCLESRIGLVAYTFVCHLDDSAPDAVLAPKGQRKRRNQAGKAQNLICPRRLDGY